MASPDEQRAGVSIATQIYAALNAAHIENGYPHDFDQPAGDVVLEIHEYHGIDGFDPDFRRDMAHGRLAVAGWRGVQTRAGNGQGAGE